MDNYETSIDTIASVCEKLGIPCDKYKCLDGFILRFPLWSDGDIACHSGTYGSNAGMVESYRFSWDGDDVSVLTVEEAIVYLILEYNNYKNGK